ncbi:MAG: maltooligosyl trehalose hydrolase [Humibacillus sp.]|nr:maltooligosyl trehalose hydrolase [Humibacillus sp.]
MADHGAPHHPGLGSMPHEGGTAFRVWAPNADAVAVTGSFTEWSGDGIPLEPEEAGHWYVDVDGVGSGAEYQFVITRGDDRLMRIDPRARAVTNSSGNALVYDRAAFDWQGDGFACPPHDELVIYETHIGSFRASEGDGGDLAGVAGKLGYLVALGINAIELMPVAEFAGDYSWGYNPSNPFAVESSYGGPDLLKAFVREAHQHGIAVIVDVVLNHFGPSDLALWQFDGWSEEGKGGIYFYNDERSSTPWGDTRPDYGRAEVRNYLHDNALMWFDEYHMDGLRFDATLYIRTIDGVGTGDLPEGWNVMRDITASVRESRPDKILIAEDLQNDPALTTFGEGGAGFHSQWDAGFVHPVRQVLTAVDDAERSMTELAEAIGHDDNPFARIIYTESHDEVANGKLRLTQEIDGNDPGGWAAQKRATLGLCLALTGHGIPMLFQGQEFLEDEWFRDDVPLDWDRAEHFRDIVRLARDLIRLRRNADGDSAGLTGDHFALLHLDDEAKSLAWARSRGEETAVVVANLSAEARDIEMELPAEGRWTVRFNSDASTYSALFSGHHTDDVEAAPPSADRPATGTVSVGPYTLVVLIRS